MKSQNQTAELGDSWGKDHEAEWITDLSRRVMQEVAEHSANFPAAYENVQKIIAQLMLDNWEARPWPIPEEDRRQYLHYWEDRAVCGHCGRRVPVPLLVSRRISSNDAIFIVLRWKDYYSWCLPCFEEYMRDHVNECLVCGRLYVIKDTPYDVGLCESCDRGDYRSYIEAVQTHLERARMAHAPATLTPKQWLKTIRRFGYSCAYCHKRDAIALEHITPICRGGGTTALNCVPACKSCNSSKGGKSPEEWAGVDVIAALIAKLKDIHQIAPPLF